MRDGARYGPATRRLLEGELRNFANLLADEGGSIGPGSRAAAGRHPALDLPGAANSIHHIFGRSVHQLEGVVAHFGSPEAAYTALYDAVQAVVRAEGTSGVFQSIVTVAGELVTVRGRVIDGVLRLNTAFIPVP